LMLASTDLEASLQDYLDSGGRRVDQWIDSIPHQIVDLSDSRAQLVNFNDFEALEDTTSQYND